MSSLTFATKRSQVHEDHIIIHKHDNHFNITIGDNLNVADMEKFVDALYGATEYTRESINAPLVVTEEKIAA